MEGNQIYSSTAYHGKVQSSTLLLFNEAYFAAGLIPSFEVPDRSRARLRRRNEVFPTFLHIRTTTVCLSTTSVRVARRGSRGRQAVHRQKEAVHLGAQPPHVV